MQITKHQLIYLPLTKMHEQLIQYPFPLHQIKIHPEMNIAYMDEGKGETTLLFIHGLANYAPVWQYQIAELSKSYRCVALDLPGNGYSSRGGYPYSMFFYAETVARFIEALQLKNVVLVGHSMGGQVGMVLALRYPQLLSQLVLIASAGLEYFTQSEITLMQNMLQMGSIFYSDEYQLETAIEQSFYQRNPISASIINDLKSLMKPHDRKAWSAMSIASIQAMLNEQVYSFLPQLTLPVQIIFGKQDALIPNGLIHFGESPKSIAQKAASLIPDASVAIIPNAGHFVQLEKAAEVNAILQMVASKAAILVK
jgi:pimeloyl-ACP methyl ester carboxylesterase